MRSLLMFAILAGAPALAADGEALKKAADLPMKAQELRDSGLDADQVVATLDAAKEAKLGAGETADLLGAAAPLVKEHGPVDNFGDLVKDKISEGLRGEDLAAAIKAAHEHKGKGPDAASTKPDPAPTKPNPTTKPGPMTRPGGHKPSGITRPGGGTRPAPGPAPKPGGGGTRPAPKPGGGGGGMTRPGGAR
ncbi:MAG: hypothetical protein KDA21_14810 [Phycisphaerales bacterium]|nr:hypothetical protein [Phycisphaerales bacterium]